MRLIDIERIHGNIVLCQAAMEIHIGTLDFDHDTSHTAVHWPL
jgi:hypothetical protein